MITTNNVSLRRENRRRVLNCVREGPLSRADVADKLHLTRAAVTYIVEDLVRDGFLDESYPKSKARGRHPVLLHLKANRLYFGGINIRRDGITAGIVNLAGEEITHSAFSYDGSAPLQMLTQICDHLAKQPVRIESLGVAAPGPLDAQRSLILNPPNFDDWHGVRITGALCGVPELPVMLENISQAAALEEYYFNDMDRHHAFLALLIDSGIGSGVMIGGRAVGGSEIGHTSIVLDGRPCSCGNFGCLERYASVPALLAGSPYPTWKALMDAGGASASLLEQEARYLSQAIVNAVNTLRVEKVVLRGDITYKAERLCAFINKRVKARTVTAVPAEENPVLSSSLSCSIRTAAMPAIHRFFTG